MGYGFFPNIEGCADWGGSSGGICSGHGRCVPFIVANLTTYQCVCDPYWTGQGHFISLEKHDCSLHLPTAYAFHGILLLACSISFYTSVYKLTQFIVTGYITKKANSICGVIQKVATQSLAFRATSALFLWSIIGILLCFFQFTGTYIGETHYTSILMGIFLILYWVAGLFGTRIYIVLHLSLVKFSGDEEHARTRIQRFGINPCNIIIPQIFIQAIPVCLLSISTVNPMLRQQILTFLFAIFNLWAQPVGVGTCIIFTYKLATLLDSGDQNFFQQQKRRNLSQLLKALAKQLVVSLTISQILYYLAVFWPYFRTRMTYFLPLLYSSAALAFKRGAEVYDSQGSIEGDKNLEVFQHIVNDEYALDLFSKFVQNEHSSENLLFWRQVEDFRLSLVRGDLPEPSVRGGDPIPTALERAKQIYNDFIKNEVVNLPFSIRIAINIWYENVTSTDQNVVSKHSEIPVLISLYKSSQHEIWNLMKTDSLTRFVKSVDFKRISERWAADTFLKEVAAISPSQKSRGEYHSAEGRSKAEIQTQDNCKNSLLRSDTSNEPPLGKDTPPLTPSPHPPSVDDGIDYVF